MRDTADPDVHQDAPPATPEPTTPEPTPAPAPAERTEPAEAPAATTAQEQDDPQPARVTPGPVIAMTAETITAATAALWQAGGWTAVGLGAAGLAGAGAAAVAGRRKSGGWKTTRTRTRSWSTGSSGASRRAVPASFGRGSSTSRRGRAGMPSLGGTGRGGARGAGSRVGSRAGGASAAGRRAGRAGFPGAGKSRTTGAVGSGRRVASATGPALRKASSGARRAARAGSGALDRATAGAIRGRAAARAARAAVREGGTPRAASRAARAALKNAHQTTPVKGAWRRTLGAAAWGAGGWGIGWGARLIGSIRDRFRIRPGDQRTDEEGAEQPRIDKTVDRPANPAAGGHTGGADTMTEGGAPIFVTAAEELADAFRKYEPPPGAGGMIQMYTDVGMLPDALEQITIGLNVLADRCHNELPLNSVIGDMVHELAKVQAHMASVAAEIKPAIERLHEPEMTRTRSPRPREADWNV